MEFIIGKKGTSLNPEGGEIMEFERGINYYELDGMNVVHHSNYIRYMEEARIYLLDKIGLPYKKIEDNGIMIPVLEVNYKYSCESRYI